MLRALMRMEGDTLKILLVVKAKRYCNANTDDLYKNFSLIRLLHISSKWLVRIPSILNPNGIYKLMLYDSAGCS